MNIAKSSLIVGLALTVLTVAGWHGARAALALAPQPEDRTGRIGPKPPRPELATFRTAIPRATYQTIVVSARLAPRGVEIVPFVIRSRDGMNGVSDFTFYVPAGTTQTLCFPAGWATPTDAVLFALDGAEFAAWGVTMGNAGGPGSMVRFDPVGRDTARDLADRERERDFEAFLREQQRNK